MLGIKFLNKTFRLVNNSLDHAYTITNLAQKTAVLAATSAYQHAGEEFKVDVNKLAQTEASYKAVMELLNPEE